MVRNEEFGIINVPIITSIILALIIAAIIWVSFAQNKVKKAPMAGTPIAVKIPAMAEIAGEEAKLENTPADEFSAIKSEAELKIAEEKHRAAAIAARFAAEKKRLMNIQEAKKKTELQAADLAKKLKFSQSQNQTLAAMQANSDEKSMQIVEKLRAEILSHQKLSAEASNTHMKEVAGSDTNINEKSMILIEKLLVEIASHQTLTTEVSSINQKKASSYDAGNNPANSPSIRAAIGAVVSSASQADQDYIKALSGNVDPFIKTRSQQRALEKVGTKGVDYFNRIEVASTSTNTKMGAIISKVEQLLKDRDKKTQELQSSRDQRYLSSLNPLVEQRNSESRFITVKRGDTLSGIAERAYGDWRLYRRIYAANPQLITNPNLIFPGQVLRVPL